VAKTKITIEHTDDFGVKSEQVVEGPGSSYLVGIPQDAENVLVVASVDVEILRPVIPPVAMTLFVEPAADKGVLQKTFKLNVKQVADILLKVAPLFMKAKPW